MNAEVRRRLGRRDPQGRLRGCLLRIRGTRPRRNDARRDPHRSRRAQNVTVVGFATDHCVKATALDARALGLEVTVLLALRRRNARRPRGRRSPPWTRPASPSHRRAISEPVMRLGKRFDESGEIFPAVAVDPREVDQISGPATRAPLSGDPDTRDATPSTKFEQSFVTDIPQSPATPCWR